MRIDKEQTKIVIKKIVNELSNTVGATMGAGGRNILPMRNLIPLLQKTVLR
jgi:hypothetical protein